MFKLALLLGKTVGEIEHTMSSVELTEWLAYASIEPLPDAHWDSANVAFHVNRAMGGKGRFESFLPQTEHKRRQSEPKVKLDAKQSRGLLSRLCGQTAENPPCSKAGSSPPTKPGRRNAGPLEQGGRLGD